jgi:LL-diaminopimelate aminotransferase
MSGWEFFDFLLTRAGVVGTPGEGFGKCGAGYLILNACGSYEDTKKALERIKTLV